MIKPLDFNKDPWPVKLAALALMVALAVVVVLHVPPGALAVTGASGAAVWALKRRRH